jgi:hypothetical protein
MFNQAFRKFVGRHVVHHYSNPYPNIVLFTGLGGIAGANSDNEIRNGVLGACIGATVSLPFAPFIIIGACGGMAVMGLRGTLHYLENIMVVAS